VVPGGCAEGTELESGWEVLTVVSGLFAEGTGALSAGAADGARLPLGSGVCAELEAGGIADAVVGGSSEDPVDV
jgi:hypothetical protein